MSQENLRIQAGGIDAGRGEDSAPIIQHRTRRGGGFEFGHHLMESR
jgi:hypothetical protein